MSEASVQLGITTADVDLQTLHPSLLTALQNHQSIHLILIGGNARNKICEL